MNDVINAAQVGTIQIPTYLLIIIIVWIFFWKILALWQAAEKKQKVWFAVLLVINTLGIIDIFYYAYWSRRSLGFNGAIEEFRKDMSGWFRKK